MAELWWAIIGPVRDDPQNAFWVIAVASLTNVACAVLGCYLVLRRMSMMGDALSHAVLPGLVIAFILFQSLGIWYMFAGALVIGLVTTLLTQLLHRLGGVPADASMGVVFTSLFALGVLLLHTHARYVHIDVDCVLEGLLGQVDLYTVSIAGREIPEQFITILPVMIINVGFVSLFWKELKISSFDAELATSMGMNANLMHYLLMGLVALTAVASFQAVGSILVVAMFIVPPATAHLFCDRLGRMQLVASSLGILTAVVGYWLYIKTNTNAAGMMAVTAGGFYALAVFFSPRYGIVSTLARNVRMSLRILREDLLAMLYRLEELAVSRRLGRGEAAEAVGGGLLAYWSLSRLIRQGQVEDTGKGLQLTNSGRNDARQLVRSHRLWEAYLVQQLGLPLDHVHDPAERMEHYIDDDLRKQIAHELKEAAIDPHGRDIPGGEKER